MATFDLAGAGVHGLTNGTLRIFVEILAYPVGYSTGRSNPVNYFDVGLLRWGVQGAYGPPFAIDASTIFRDAPSGVTSLGYALFGTTAVRVTEAF